MGNRENRLEIIIGAKKSGWKSKYNEIYCTYILSYIVIYRRFMEIYNWKSNQNKIKIYWKYIRIHCDIYESIGNILLDIKSKSD